MVNSRPARSTKREKTHAKKHAVRLQKLFAALHREIDHAALPPVEEPTLPDPGVFVCAGDFGRQYLRYNAYRKREFNLDGSELDRKLLEVEAITAFDAVEARMAILNRTWNFQAYDRQQGAAEAAHMAIMSIAKRKVAELLSEFSYDEWIDSCEFSGGASTRLKRREAHPSRKYTGPLHVTANAAHLGTLVIKWHESWDVAIRTHMKNMGDGETDWVAAAIQVVPGSIYFTVPKTYKSVRGACKEPELNMFMQKGIGTMIRRRLKRVGINLDDQSLNAELARLGSLDGSLATIDLASASDSVSLGLVEWLLPPEWFDMIARTRSEYVQFVDDKGNVTRTKYLNKVSSMGNGFTFEVESLIFWALLRATMDHLGSEDRRHGVYGDDLVVPTACSSQLMYTLNRCGFEVNIEKSWTDGPFRESCGSHYFHGVDVTPFHIKRLRADNPGDVYHLVNRLRGHHVTSRPSFYRWVLKLFDVPEYYVPGNSSSRSGILTREGDVPLGTYFCFQRQMYVYHHYLERSKIAQNGEPGAYLFQLHGNISPCDWGSGVNRAQSKDYVGIPAEERGVVAKFTRGTTSVWDELPSVAPLLLTL